jgi:enterochelin esterase-like enzyme
MRKKEIPHEFRTRDGGHNWTYWRASLPEVLRFVSDAFHQY